MSLSPTIRHSTTRHRTLAWAGALNRDLGESSPAAMRLTNYHVKYFAHDLTRRAASGMDRLSMSLFDAAVDLNPH
jgi:hypothetical protein